MHTEKKLLPGEIPTGIMTYILRSLQDSCFGQVVLVAQDGRLVQVERSERLRIADCRVCREREAMPPEEVRCIAKKIQQSFQNLAYGQLVIVVKSGAVTQIERTEKSRFTGLDGEGI